MRKLCAFAIPFSGAVFLAVYLLPEAWRLPAAGLCALAALPCLLWRGEGRLPALLIVLGLAAGLLWTWGYTQWKVAPARALDGQTCPIQAQVLDWPRPSARGISVPVQVEGTRAMLYAEGDFGTLKPGDFLTGEASFRRSDQMRGETYLGYHAKGIFLIAYAKGTLQNRAAERTPVRILPRLMAGRIRDTIGQIYPQDVAPLITALLTGEKSGLDGGLYRALQRTGLAHVVAVSGMHVSFVAGLAVTLLGKGRRRSAAAGIVLCLLFAAVAGFSPSVLRAVFLQACTMLAPLLGREEDKPTTLSAALCFLLICNPYQAASISLQLSFAAVAGIYLAAQPLYRRWTGRLPHRPKGRGKRFGCALARLLLGSLATTLGALLFTTPLTAYYFGMLSLIAPLANLAALWAVSLAFTGGLIAVLAGLICPVLGTALAVAATLLARYVIWVALLLGKLPFAAIPLISLYLRVWLACAYGVMLLLLLQRGARPVVPLCGCGGTLAVALVLHACSLAGPGLSAAVLDVGQGQSVALSCAGHWALVDCGGNTLTDPGDVAADYIQSTGSSYLDMLILTHCHADHAGGVPQLLERLEVGLILLPDSGPEDPLRRQILTLAEEKDIPVQTLSEHAQAPLGEATLTLYAPLGDGGSNEEGLSVLCTRGEFDILITGDMNSTVEGRLIKYGDLPQVEALVVGHHGSRHASSPALLEAIDPDYAVISVGWNNYGHPAPETLARLEEAGCAIYRTDWMGTVQIQTQDQSPPTPVGIKD